MVSKQEVKITTGEGNTIMMVFEVVGLFDEQILFVEALILILTAGPSITKTSNWVGVNAVHPLVSVSFT